MEPDISPIVQHDDVSTGNLIDESPTLDLKTQNTNGNTKVETTQNELPPVDFEEFKNVIHVTPNGEYRTIQSAIDAALPKTKIVIHSGIYKEHLLITQKSDIELTSEDPTMPAIIVSVNTPCLTIINMNEDATVKIGNLRFLQRGMREDSNNNTTYDDIGDTTDQAEKSALTTSFGHLRCGQNVFNNAHQIDQFEYNFNIDINVMESIMADNRGYVSAINIVGATVMIINTQITLGFLTTETTKIIHGIYSEKAVLFMESVLIKGNYEFLTCGVFSYDSSIKVTNSRIVKHHSGGILCSITGRNQVVITKTQMLENTGCGLLIINRSNNKSANATGNEIQPLPTIGSKKSLKSSGTGSSSSTGDKNTNQNEVSLESNLIDGNRGVGIKIENCGNLSIIRNKFYDNKFSGAEIIDCDGLVMLNEFVKNGENGININALNKKVELKFRKNIACENVFNGVAIKGKHNNALITLNEKITNNMRSGIIVFNKASPIIKNNIISTNLFQGVLVCSDASANIEENKIFGNLKANVAFGGEAAKDTSIVNNELYRSRSEGVFVIEGKGGLIARNKIFENNDGIVMFETDDVEISENDIFKNVRSGVLVASKSNPKMYSNQVMENRFIGMLFRDDSRGEYKNNIVNKNPTQAYYDNSCKDLIDIQNENNTIEGRIDMETRCIIF